MESFKRIVGVYLIIVAAVVAIHTVVEPLYYTSTEASPYSPHWSKLNALMVLAIVLGVIFGYIRKRGAGGGASINREYLEANIQFYGLLFVGILFFWNFFNLHSPGFTAIAMETVSAVWIVIDAALPLLLAAMGFSMLRSRE
ncbi:MAG: hypothetical protein OXH06_04700 [Gemmatimonadetes bacterium]|nr:hypothetical protein [Gemmatimonadota bacterium]MDE3259237.1 hypothetical protein [Gemmatimonadota bacterium]